MSCNTCAKQASGVLGPVGVPPNQVMGVYGKRAFGQSWEFLPRCPGCKRWVSPRHGICNYSKCKRGGSQVAQPTGWPPEGVTILRTKAAVRAARAEEKKRLPSKSSHSPKTALASLNALQPRHAKPLCPPPVRDESPAETFAPVRYSFKESVPRFPELLGQMGLTMQGVYWGLADLRIVLSREKGTSAPRLGKDLELLRSELASLKPMIEDLMGEFKEHQVCPDFRGLNMTENIEVDLSPREAVESFVTLVHRTTSKAEEILRGGGWQLSEKVVIKDELGDVKKLLETILKGFKDLESSSLNLRSHLPFSDPASKR